MIAATSWDSKMNSGMSGWPTNKPSQGFCRPSIGYLRERVRNGGAWPDGGCAGLTGRVAAGAVLGQQALTRFSIAARSCAETEDTASAPATSMAARRR